MIEIKRSGKNVDEVAVDPELIEYARNLAQHYDEVVKITPEEQIEESPNKLNMIFQNTLRNFN